MPANVYFAVGNANDPTTKAIWWQGPFETEIQASAAASGYMRKHGEAVSARVVERPNHWRRWDREE